jgi:ATP-dependent DNA helicase RecQ
LQEEGIHALFYHAGLRAKERHEIQDKFMSGQAEVIVATNAFGMGVDKADVRFVYHYDITDSLDSYYQEIGRSGRNGEPAEAVLFYRAQNIGLRKFQAGTGKLEKHQIAQVARLIHKQNGQFDVGAIARECDLSTRKVTSIVNRLRDAGALGPDVDPDQAADLASMAQERLKAARRERIEKIQSYAETSSCRREFLLKYFGDDFTGPCGNCDNDQAPNTAPAV